MPANWVPGRGRPIPRPLPRTIARPLRRARAPREELADATAHGDVYIRRLRQAQLNLSLMALVAFGGLFGALPVALFEIPALQRWHPLGVPAAVILLLVPLWPLLLAIAYLYRRRADTLDNAFRELVREE